MVAAGAGLCAGFAQLAGKELRRRPPRKGVPDLKLQITVEGKTYEVEVEVLEEDEGTPSAAYGTYPPASAKLESNQGQGSPLESGAAWAEVNGEKVCCSPITGLVIRVNVEAGQIVEKGHLLMVLEAMKMETNISAPGPGKVKHVNVAAGDSVKLNQVIVECE